tara:strand:- start:6 stop:857 length:852 start_codon:yes stop_codon:yes gene_type:complete
MIERMKIDVVQNTPPWFDWRNNLRQASDAPTVIGANPYSTVADLWQIKQGLKTVTKTPAMEHGSNTEPVARAIVAKELNVELNPECWQYGTYGASLDAITADGSIKVEIKCPKYENSSIWKEAQKEKIVPYVFWQLVHQQYVRPTSKTYLFVYFDDAKYKLIDATDLITQDHIKELLDAWDDFYQNPPLIERDDDVIKALVMQHRDVLAQEALIKTKKAELEKAIAAECQSDTVAFGSKIVTQSRKGAIDYKSIKELEPLNLEAYRKPSTSFQVIKHPKEVLA